MKVTLKLGALEAEALLEILVRTFTTDPHARAAISSIYKQMGALEAKREKRRSTSKLWDRLMERSGGQCECGCGIQFGHLDFTPEMDHWHGRARAPENEETCWLLARCCHRMKTGWRPSRAEWAYRWRVHQEREENCRRG